MGFLANATIDLTAIIVVFLLYVSGKRDRQTDFRQSIFEKMILCLICFLSVDLCAWYVDGKDFAFANAVQMTLNSLVWLTQAALSFLWLIYVEYWVDSSERQIAKRIKIYAIPLILETGLLTANAFTKWLFYINDQHAYTHGALYPHILIVFYIYGIYACIITMKAYFSAKDEEQKKNCLWMSGFMALPCAFSVVRVFTYGISLISPIYALSLLMVYLNVHQ